MKKKNDGIAVLFVLPLFFGIFLFYYFPFFTTIKESFWSDVGFIGIYEYKKLFLSEAFRLSIRNMTFFSLTSIPLLFILALSTALSMRFLNLKKCKIVSVLFLLHLLPMLIPSAVITVVLKIFLETYGVLNGFLVEHGKESIDFLYSKYDIIILEGIYLWKNYGYCMIVLYGGINGVPEETIESAKLDGAGNFTILIHIILPQIRSFLLFVGSLGIVGVFKIFREEYLLFGKYPYDSVYMLQNFINNKLYAMDYGSLSAASLILILSFSVLIYFIFIKKGKENEE
ncbi:MAG: sugar ABC transporter permease [Acetatifactor sp.]|nr:sugar ABC transporter permease [Acetatifactor sp.]